MQRLTAGVVAEQRVDTLLATARGAEGRVRHMPARAGATLDFVPIDHVAAGFILQGALDRLGHIEAAGGA